ncbi:FtsX-like permease family protein, partial [Collinsella aerofaciens]|nr:FtsX-like permease family protein [Collinsella aerofaciens]
MGILLSIGNSKRSIAGQFILEGVLILAVSVILAGGMAAGVSNGIGNWMLSGMNAQAQRVENARNE